MLPHGASRNASGRSNVTVTDPGSGIEEISVHFELVEADFGMFVVIQRSLQSTYPRFAFCLGLRN